VEQLALQVNPARADRSDMRLERRCDEILRIIDEALAVDSMSERADPGAPRPSAVGA
jgi:hypothetical protein